MPNQALLLKNTTCVACGSSLHKRLFQLQQFLLLQCCDCGLAWLLGEVAALHETYSKEYFVGGTPEGYEDYFALQPGLTKTFTKRIRELQRLGLGQDSTLLEVGCGPGLFLNLARDHFKEVQGVEISEFAARYAREQLGLNVMNKPFQPGVIAHKLFDVVVLWDVIEHLPNPYDALCEVRRLLRPRGWCVLTTGDISSLAAGLSGRRWHLLNVPEHLFYFSPRSLRVLLERCGLQVQQISYNSSYFPIQYLVERLFKTAFGRCDYRSPKWLTRWTVPVPVNLFDIMTVYIMKTE